MSTPTSALKYNASVFTTSSNDRDEDDIFMNSGTESSINVESQQFLPKRQNIVQPLNDMINQSDSKQEIETMTSILQQRSKQLVEKEHFTKIMMSELIEKEGQRKKLEEELQEKKVELERYKTLASQRTEMFNASHISKIDDIYNMVKNLDTSKKEQNQTTNSDESSKSIAQDIRLKLGSICQLLEQSPSTSSKIFGSSPNTYYSVDFVQNIKLKMNELSKCYDQFILSSPLNSTTSTRRSKEFTPQLTQQITPSIMYSNPDILDRITPVDVNGPKQTPVRISSQIHFVHSVGENRDMFTSLVNDLAKRNSAAKGVVVTDKFPENSICFYWYRIDLRSSYEHFENAVNAIRSSAKQNNCSLVLCLYGPVLLDKNQIDPRYESAVYLYLVQDYRSMSVMHFEDQMNDDAKDTLVKLITQKF